MALGLLAALVLLVMTGCKKSAANGSGQSGSAEVYTLVSVDGKTLPCDDTHEGAGAKIESGTFTLAAGGTCTNSIVMRMAGRRDMANVTTATCTRQGADLTMQWDGAGTAQGSFSGNTFTMTNENMVFVYQK